MSKVVCKTKRIGGAFGGKETTSAFLAAVASVPSYLLNRPVKLTLDRDIDMMTTGQRHSFLGKYKVLFLFVLLDNTCQNKIILLNYGAVYITGDQLKIWNLFLQPVINLLCVFFFFYSWLTVYYKIDSAFKVKVVREKGGTFLLQLF